LLIEPIYTLAVGQPNTGHPLAYRPGATEFIQRLAVSFDIVFYSSRESHYLSMIRNHIDPSNMLIKQILDYKHCVRTASNRIVKDLTIVTGYSLRDIVMVDYKPQNVNRQLANAVCLLYFDPGRPEITEYLLGECLQHLLSLSCEPDVRMSNSHRLPYYQFLELKTNCECKDRNDPYLF
jgi:NLI interacting factor-like phosphatase